MVLFVPSEGSFLSPAQGPESSCYSGNSTQPARSHTRPCRRCRKAFLPTPFNFTRFPCACIANLRQYRIILSADTASEVRQPPERCLRHQAGIVRCCLKSRKSPPRDQTTASPKRLVKSRNIRICAVSLIMIIIPLLPHHLKRVKNHCQTVQFFEIVFGQIVTCQAMALTVFPIILPPWVSDRLPFLGIRNFLHEKAVHWYCTNKPPLRNWRAYFDNPLLF